MYYDAAYAPFGENYAGAGTQDLSFTGQNQGTESSVSGGAGGLYDFMFRKHSPVQGRWLSPDPSGMAATNPANPRSWNRYAYVANKPLSAIDPLGLLDCDGSGTCLWSGGGGDGGYTDTGYCPPSLPYCGDDPFGGDGGGWGGGGGDGGGGAPPVPRHGGVWPDNETLGLPTGLNTSPLGSDDLLGFLPGLDCIGIGIGSGFTSIPFPDPNAKKKGPCITIDGDGKKQNYEFLLSKDKKTLVRLTKMDLSKDPYVEVMKKIDVKGRPVRGNPNAKVVAVNYDDFQCPFCSRVHQILFPELLKEYGDRVAFIYKDFPLSEIHPWAVHAAVNATCLAPQNVFSRVRIAAGVHGVVPELSRVCAVLEVELGAESLVE